MRVRLSVGFCKSSGLSGICASDDDEAQSSSESASSILFISILPARNLRTVFGSVRPRGDAPEIVRGKDTRTASRVSRRGLRANGRRHPPRATRLIFVMPSVGFEPTTNGLCLPLRLSPRPASAGFVVWTFSSLYASAVKSLHLPQKSLEAWLGITVPLSRLRLPRI